MKMLRALALARNGMGLTTPNPPVGAILVRDGRIVGSGFHQRAGELHAERVAIAHALSHGESLAGAELYVTLEPCNHTGRTPPCTDAILESHISSVIIGSEDPNPRVVGGGGEMLRGCGVAVSYESDPSVRALARGLLAPWRKSLTEALPFVTLKLALSAERSIAPAGRGNVWLSSPASRAFVQRLRSRVDAIAVGIGTILLDDPLLTNRLGRGAVPQRVVFDSKLRMPSSARALRQGTIVMSCVADGKRTDAIREKGGEVIHVPTTEGRLDLRLALTILKTRGIHHLLCEGGGALSRSLLREGLVDELILVRTAIPVGPGGVEWSDSHFALEREFALEATRKSGGDIIENWRKRQ